MHWSVWILLSSAAAVTQLWNNCFAFSDFLKVFLWSEWWLKKIVSLVLITWYLVFHCVRLFLWHLFYCSVLCFFSFFSSLGCCNFLCPFSWHNFLHLDIMSLFSCLVQCQCCCFIIADFKKYFTNLLSQFPKVFFTMCVQNFSSF